MTVKPWLKLTPRWQPRTCSNIKTWIKAQPASSGSLVCATVLEPQLFYLTLPSTVEPSIYPIFPKKKERRSPYRSPEQYLARLHNVKLINSSGLLILPDGQYATEPLTDQKYLADMPECASFVRRQLTKLKKVKKQGAYYSLLQIYCNGHNAYHWFHDVLQNLYVTLEHLPPDITYIVPENLRQWQYESLKAIGIERSQTRPFQTGAVWELETLFFAPPVKGLGQDLPGLNEWLRAACYREFNIHASKIERNQLIYISREQARGRKIANETDVMQFLQTKGFKRYFLEEMSLEQIVRLFATAKVVVSPHGAGLTNLIFAQPQTKVIEIFEPTAKEIGACYWSLSAAMNHDYWYLLGDRVENNQTPEQPNIKVPLDKLDKTLHQLNPLQISS